MIRVNLLAVPAGAPKRDWFPTEQRSAMAGLLMLVVTAAGTGMWWWETRAARIHVDNAIAADERDILHLRDVARLVDGASARRAELSERVALIERLRVTQHDPVTLLETVSRSLPDGLWLTEIRQSGTSVQIDGRATSVTPVTDFAEHMQDSGAFERPVEIVTMTSDIVEETPVVRFTLKAQVVDKSKPAAPATPGPAAGAASTHAAPTASGGQDF